MNALLASIARPDSRALAWATAALAAALTVVIAVELARVTWLLWPRPEAATPPPPRPLAAQPVAASETAGPDLASLHLMGEAPDEPAARPAVIEAPETRLNLQLRGVLFHSARQSARAIIAAGGRDEDFYAVGAELPGGAVLDDIYPEKVILRRDGRYETLSLPQDALEGAVEDAPAEPQPAAASRAQPSPATRSASGDALSRIREQLTEDPAAIQRYLQPVPAVDETSGRMIGFRLTPGQDPTLFRATGLRPDDVVTSIGGVPLSDPDNGFLALEQLSTSPQVRLTVLRDGVEQTVELQFE